MVWHLWKTDLTVTVAPNFAFQSVSGCFWSYLLSKEIKSKKTWWMEDEYFGPDLSRFQIKSAKLRASQRDSGMSFIFGWFTKVAFIFIRGAKRSVEMKSLHPLLCEPAFLLHALSYSQREEEEVQRTHDASLANKKGKLISMDRKWFISIGPECLNSSFWLVINKMRTSLIHAGSRYSRVRLIKAAGCPEQGSCLVLTYL